MFTLMNLDVRTRFYMMDELRLDVAEGRLYESPRLSLAGNSVYLNLLRDAIATGSPESLIASLNSPRYFNTTERRRTENGGTKEVRIPATAAETLGEGEFNRFYIRGLCVRAIENRIDRLIVYRAKAVDAPRSESQQHIGDAIDPRSLLTDVRARADTMFGIPNGPNSGLSVRLPMDVPATIPR